MSIIFIVEYSKVVVESLIKILNFSAWSCPFCVFLGFPPVEFHQNLVQISHRIRGTVLGLGKGSESGVSVLHKFINNANDNISHDLLSLQ